MSTKSTYYVLKENKEKGKYYNEDEGKLAVGEQTYVNASEPKGVKIFQDVALEEVCQNCTACPCPEKEKAKKGIPWGIVGPIGGVIVLFLVLGILAWFFWPGTKYFR